MYPSAGKGEGDKGKEEKKKRTDGNALPARVAEEKRGGVRFLFIPRDKEGVAKAVILHRQFIIH